MEKTNYLRKIRPFVLLLTIPVSILFFISSCKSKKTEKEEKGAFACDITLPAADMQKNWADPKYTIPGDPNEIVTVDIVVSWDPVSKTMQVTLKGLRKDYSEVKGSEIPLFDGTSCPKPGFTSIPEHNYFTLADLGVVDAQGRLTNFNYIRFLPQKYSRDGSVMNFAISVTTGGVSDPKDESLPCPPCRNCVPPCPEDCTPACTKEDSAIVFDPISIVAPDTAQLRK